MFKRVAIVQSGSLTKYNRMDAKFYLALQSVQGRDQELQATVPLAEIQRRLSLLTPQEKEPCLVLARGQAPNLQAIEKEYPFLAWALIEPTLEALEREQADHLERLRARLNDIKQWRRP